LPADHTRHTFPTAGGTRALHTHPSACLSNRQPFIYCAFNSSQYTNTRAFVHATAGGHFRVTATPATRVFMRAGRSASIEQGRHLHVPTFGISIFNYRLLPGALHSVGMNHSGRVVAGTRGQIGRRSTHHAPPHPTPPLPFHLLPRRGDISRCRQVPPRPQLLDTLRALQAHTTHQHAWRRAKNGVSSGGLTTNVALLAQRPPSLPTHRTPRWFTFPGFRYAVWMTVGGRRPRPGKGTFAISGSRFFYFSVVRVVGSLRQCLLLVACCDSSPPLWFVPI